MKHTNGKWMTAIHGKNVHGKDKYQVISDIPYEGVMGSDTETPICNIDQFGTYEEHKANAKLIAAAPELLGAALATIEIMKSIRDELEGISENLRSEIRSAIIINDGVIKKATA